MRKLIRTGLQLPFFSLPSIADRDLFEHTAATAKSAEDAGFDAVFVMDHFVQLPFLGGMNEPMLEGYSLLSGIAARTSKVKLGTLVTGITYRNPALLAKTITTLDVISGGRAICGLGAAWYEEEHKAFGYEYPPTKTRFEMLEEAIEIAQAMFAGDSPTIEGKHARTYEVPNVPAPVTPGGPPLLIGGAGEKKTLPLAVKTADASNLNCEIPEVPQKIARINELLAESGRDRDSLNVTLLASMVVASDEAEAEAKLRQMVAGRGMDPAALDDDNVRSMMLSRMIVGGVDRAAEQVAKMCGPDGIDGIVAMLPADAEDPNGPAVAAEVFKAAGLID